MQMAIIDLIKMQARGGGAQDAASGGGGNLKSKWIRTIFELLESNSHAVKYEAANTLTSLTQNPAAVKGESMGLRIPLLTFTSKLSILNAFVRVHPSLAAAAGAFVDLIVKEADNNVKLIVLDRLNHLRERHPHVLDGIVMDILKVLSR